MDGERVEGNPPNRVEENCVQQVMQAWAGIDAGKEHHHVVVIDSEGHRLLSRRVLNDESELSAIIDAALNRARTVAWAIDLADGPAALVITLLLERQAAPGVPARCRGEPRVRRLPRRGQDPRKGRCDHR
jgi:Transposase